MWGLQLLRRQADLLQGLDDGETVGMGPRQEASIDGFASDCQLAFV